MWFGVLVSTFKKSVPEWEPTGLAVHTGFLAMAVVLTIWLWYDWPVSPMKPHLSELESVPYLPLRVTGPIYVAIVYPAIVLALAAVSVATHSGEWDSNMHKRFGEEPIVSAP
jgi:hypothetical protein